MVAHFLQQSQARIHAPRILVLPGVGQDVAALDLFGCDPRDVDRRPRTGRDALKLATTVLRNKYNIAYTSAYPYFYDLTKDPSGATQTQHSGFDFTTLPFPLRIQAFHAERGRILLEGTADVSRLLAAGA